MHKKILKSNTLANLCFAKKTTYYIYFKNKN